MAWGQVTATVYGLIRDSKHADAIKFLEEQLWLFPENQAALSLLGYCHYVLGDFHAASSMYQKLTKICPNQENYRLYHAQSLYKAGMLCEAGKVCLSLEGMQRRVLGLQACIRYEEGDIAGTSFFIFFYPPASFYFSGSRMILEEQSRDDMDAAVNLGCCLYKEGSYQEAYSKFTDAINAFGFQASTFPKFQPELAYNRAVCLYRLKHYGPALSVLAEIIEHGVRQYPELSIGSHVEGIELCSVGNSPALKESALVEAFNLKAAIDYANGNLEAAKENLTDMPPRAEEELDSVTLHNQALMNMEVDPTAGFRKLNFLLQNPPFPSETLANLLLLYCKPSHGFYDLAADVMAEHAEVIFKYLSQDLYDFINCIILTKTSPEDAYQKMNELANRYSETMRRLTKQIQDSCLSRDQEGHKKALAEYEDCLEYYIPIIMAIAKLFWDKENYVQVERIFHQSADLCSDHPVWRLNVAHTFFMQDNRYKEAIHYYEPIVKKAGDDILSVTAIVLANLCVSYIMTSQQNEEAEDLMRKIEKEEERAHYENPDKQELHLCIVNLVIGTLYCAKQNFEFGISRIIRSLEPYGKKLEADTWFYAKRCFLALVDSLAKQMIVLKDATYADIDDFLDAADSQGKTVYTSVESPGEGQNSNTVSREARLLKRMFLKIRE
ncbi:hypothetical protein SELMODRAFT_124642 [Selaginella moellendorffii]|uniref:Tetratricopeptide repeat protein 30 n=1 Tax=Selaginella moellendorffii TaxID=88036 RepID=D8STM9_SELML|nr:hypothetical protein SELMODRAFT_124642 [Selaginella moellendorffii]